MNKSTFVSISVFLLAIFCMKPLQSHSQDVTGKWTGTMSMETISQSQLLGNTTIRVYLTITDNVVTGSVEGTSRTIIEGKEVGNASCTGAGTGELWRVAFSQDGNTYDLQAISPLFTCTKRNLILGTTEIEQVTSGLDLIVDQQPMGANRNVLIGSHTETGGIADGTSTTTITWNLTSKPLNTELIVTPIGYDSDGIQESYDDWLPEPGKDELTRGSTMKINLKVRNKDGQPLRIRVKRFELTLTNTSVEPGITINYPVSTRATQLPDLRFLPLGIGESMSEDQFLSIPSQDGSIGKATIASYDGGGWTTLTVEAILNDETHLKGHLLVSNGETDIRIPKRDIGSKIATVWLNANKYSNNSTPGETDDKEESDVNHHKGDGLTAYEEYRGIISIDTFRRLSPKKKELGIVLRQRDFNVFQLGIRRFENASGIKVYVFGQNEIPENRRLNQNAKSAHDFNQYVLRLSNDKNNSEIDIYQMTVGGWGVTYPKNDIPARVTHIVVDVNKITDWYNSTRTIYGARLLPFTDKDLVASTTAHEIGHGVSLPHHADKIPYLPGFTANSNPPRIFNADATGSWEVFERPWPIEGKVGSPGDTQSGNVFCFMCYRNKSQWVKKTVGNVDVYYWIPWLKAGSLFCIDKKGEGINANNEYFGDGTNGDCLGNIKLRD